MALVNQDPVLFSGSIRDNIAYGLLHCSMDEIQEAARKANAHDFILKLKDGYNTGKNVRLRNAGRKNRQSSGISMAR